MKVFSFGKDGGKESNVIGFWLIEIKSLFSIVLLRFNNKSREAYHNHAFNCFSWLISGKLVENMKDGSVNIYKPSIFGFPTYRETYHKVDSDGISYVLSLRGPWSKTWNEMINGDEITLTNGRKII